MLHRHKHCLQTDQNEILHDPRPLGVPPGASKMIFQPMVRSAQSMHLSCVKFSTISKRTESSFHLSLITYNYHWVCPKWFLSLWYVWRKPCTYLTPTLTLFLNGPKWDSRRPPSARSPSGASKMISEPVVHSAQIMHLSCVKISTISKWNEESIHLSLVS
jgi:hypothetical protein